MVDRCEPDARAEDILDARALSEQRIYNGRAARYERRLAEITQQRQHGIEPLEFQCVVDAVRDAFTHLAQYDEIEDYRRGEERILARVVHDDRVVSAQHEFARVFVHGALAIADVGHVLDDDAVVGHLLRVVKDVVRVDHVVNDVALGDLHIQNIIGHYNTRNWL